MGLRIVSEELQSGAEPNLPKDDYPDRLRKYIPAEVVGFWLAVSGMVQSAADNIPKAGLLWLLFVIGLVFTFGWTRRRTNAPGKPTAWTQIAISCGAFVVWVFATGGPLAASWEGYEPLYGSILLITYTTGVAFVIPPEK
jgi:MFS superfamily sulfate permease-like transporter